MLVMLIANCPCIKLFLSHVSNAQQISSYLEPPNFCNHQSMSSTADRQTFQGGEEYEMQDNGGEEE